MLDREFLEFESCGTVRVHPMQIKLTGNSKSGLYEGSSVLCHSFHVH